MSQMLLILIGVVLNLVPADATSVTIPTEKVEMRFTRQGGGEWSLEGSPLKFHVNNTELTLEIGDQKQKLDLSKMADIDKDTDWAKLKEIKLDGEPVQILRKPDGLDFVSQAAQGDKNAPRTYEVRWERPKAESLTLGSSVDTADAGDQEAIKKLEAKAVGYWAPDPKAMLDLYTKEKGMKEENAQALIGESKSITVEVERGTVHFFSSQGKVTVPYKIKDADVAKNSLTVIPAGAPGGDRKPLTVVIEEDRITVEGGVVPFLLRRIGKDEFKKRTKGISELRG